MSNAPFGTPASPPSCPPSLVGPPSLASRSVAEPGTPLGVRLSSSPLPFSCVRVLSIFVCCEMLVALVDSSYGQPNQRSRCRVSLSPRQERREPTGLHQRLDSVRHQRWHGTGEICRFLPGCFLSIAGAMSVNWASVVCAPSTSSQSLTHRLLTVRICASAQALLASCRGLGLCSAGA